MEYETLLYQQDGPVVTLVYNRPEQHNAINRRMNAELHAARERFRSDEETWCGAWDARSRSVCASRPR